LLEREWKEVCEVWGGGILLETVPDPTGKSIRSGMGASRRRQVKPLATIRYNDPNGIFFAMKYPQYRTALSDVGNPE